MIPVSVSSSATQSLTATACLAGPCPNSVKRTLAATVDELASVHALGSHHELLPQLEAVGVAKHDACEGGTTSRVVDDFGVQRKKRRVRYGWGKKKWTTRVANG